MSIEVKQTSTYKDEDWWDWSIWVEATVEELDQIESVVYKLHPTFPNPKRIVKDRSTNFRLNGSGWGEFAVKVQIINKDGQTIEKRHWLKLDHPENPQVMKSEPKNENPTIFVSSGISDSKFTNVFVNGLKSEGFDVLTVNDVEPGLPWEASLNSLLHRADHAVLVISGEPSSWMSNEIATMQSHNVPITPILIGAQPKLPSALSSSQSIRIKDESEASFAAHSFAVELKKVIG